ncbi:hypothetical protein GDO86_008116 [Hymenochirus boettgeri]|uniref:Uncharacterized protein n=1 Tax=Hymenochirus boettgeri TaxID=247094 RepID=A0A8T2J1S1_9PIPI|nr:hypothetical protein GDO86_008116 [Hymenochirus boettgeri]
MCVCICMGVTNIPVTLTFFTQGRSSCLFSTFIFVQMLKKKMKKNLKKSTKYHKLKIDVLMCLSAVLNFLLLLLTVFLFCF